MVILDARPRRRSDRLSQAVAEICCENGAIDVFIADTRRSRTRSWPSGPRSTRPSRPGRSRSSTSPCPGPRSPATSAGSRRSRRSYGAVASDLRPRRRRQRPHPHHEGPLRGRDDGPSPGERVAGKDRRRPLGPLRGLAGAAAGSSRASTGSASSRSPTCRSSLDIRQIELMRGIKGLRSARDPEPRQDLRLTPPGTPVRGAAATGWMRSIERGGE